MSERMLITKIVRNPDNTVDLYARGHQYRDTVLFDLSDLADANVDYESLPVGVETPCRFWAIYELSDKLNKAGNPYRDIVALGPVDRPATTTSTDTSALLADLREIKALLRHLVAGNQPTVATPDAPAGELETGERAGENDLHDDGGDGNDPFNNDPFNQPRAYGDGTLVDPTNSEEIKAFDTYALGGRLPESRQALRAWYADHATNSNGSAKPRPPVPTRTEPRPGPPGTGPHPRGGNHVHSD